MKIHIEGSLAYLEKEKKSSSNKIVTHIRKFHGVYFQTVCSTFVGVALLHSFHSSVS